MASYVPIRVYVWMGTHIYVHVWGDARGCPYAYGPAHTRMGKILVWDGTIRRRSWATESKVLAKSKKWTLLCSSKQRLQSCTADDNNETVERWARTPNCVSLKRSDCSRAAVSCLQIILSMTFTTIDVKLIGVCNLLQDDHKYISMTVDICNLDP